MQVLFIHQNFPGQYPHLAAALVRRGHQVVAIGGPTAREIPGVRLHRYNPMPPGGVPLCHAWAADFQTKCLRAEAVARLLERLIGEGLAPDLVVGHPGWGELLAVKDLLPGLPVLHQVEFVYQLEGGMGALILSFSSPNGRRAAACACGAPPSCWPSTTLTGASPPPPGRPLPLRRSFGIASA